MTEKISLDTFFLKEKNQTLNVIYGQKFVDEVLSATIQHLRNLRSKIHSKSEEICIKMNAEDQKKFFEKKAFKGIINFEMEVCYKRFVVHLVGLIGFYASLCLVIDLIE